MDELRELYLMETCKDKFRFTLEYIEWLEEKLTDKKQALQLQQTGVMARFNISEDELIKGFQNSISLLKQTTEFEVLDSFKIKVDELEKLLEETKT